MIENSKYSEYISPNNFISGHASASLLLNINVPTSTLLPLIQTYISKAYLTPLLYNIYYVNNI